MRHHRISSSLFVVLGLLALLAMPLTASAGGPAKKAPAAASKAAGKGKVNKARSEAAKKGWETRRMNQKAESNWASRVSKNPKLDKPGAKEAFVKRSVASQRGWQARKLAMAKPAGDKSAKAAKAAKAAKSAKKTKKATKTSKKSKKVAAGTGKKGKKSKNGGDAAAGEARLIDASAGAADLKNALAKFEEAQFAKSENRELDAAIAQMEGHDLMAQAAFAAADQYEAAGNAAEAEKLNKFGEDHLGSADKLEAAIQQQQAGDATVERSSQPGRIRRFFARLNPFKKRSAPAADDGQFAAFGE